MSWNVAHLPCKLLQMVNRYMRTTLPGPKAKNPMDHVKPKRTEMLAAALRS